MSNNCSQILSKEIARETSSLRLIRELFIQKVQKKQRYTRYCLSWIHCRKDILIRESYRLLVRDIKTNNKPKYPLESLCREANEPFPRRARQCSWSWSKEGRERSDVHQPAKNYPQVADLLMGKLQNVSYHASPINCRAMEHAWFEPEWHEYST